MWEDDNSQAQQIYNRMDEKQQNQGVGVYGVQKYICTIHYVEKKKVLLIILPNAKTIVMKSGLLNKAQQKQFHSSKGFTGKSFTGVDASEEGSRRLSETSLGERTGRLIQVSLYMEILASPIYSSWR